MRYLATFILLLTAAIISSLAIIYSGGKYKDAIFGAEPTETGEMLFAQNLVNRARKITLKNGAGIKTSFTFVNNAWQVDSPWKDRADPAFLRYLITFSGSLKVQDVIPRKDLDLNNFGFRKNTIEVSLADENGEHLCSYRIGRSSALHIPVTIEDKETIEPTLFIRNISKSQQDHIYVCSNINAEGIHTLFKNNFERFRDHHPFYFTPKLLDEVRLKNTQGELVISMDKENPSWKITKPLTLRTEPQTLFTFFNNLATLTAVKIEDRANITLPSGEENNTLAREISMRFAGSEKSTVLKIYPIKEGDPTALATVSDRPDVVFHIPVNEQEATSINDLELGVNDLRAKTLVHIDGKQLSTIIIRPTGKSDILLKRNPREEWKFFRNEQWETTNIGSLSELITAVTQDKITKFVTDAATDLSPYGLDQPILQLGFVTYNKTGTRLSIGQDKVGENFYAHIAGSPQIWQISTDTFSKIATNSWQWRSSYIWHLPKVDIQKVTIQKENQPVIELNYAFFNESWEATQKGKNITASLNPNRANTFLDHLTAISTPTWLSSYNPQATQLLKNPDLTISVHVQPIDSDGHALPAIIKSISIKSTPSNLLYFAKVTTTPATQETVINEANYFLLSPETIAQLNVNLFK